MNRQGIAVFYPLMFSGLRSLWLFASVFLRLLRGDLDEGLHQGRIAALSDKVRDGGLQATGMPT